MDIGPIEQQVLLAAMALHPDGYGVSIQDHIEKRTKKAPPSLGSIYAALERLEDKGFVKSRAGEPTAERGGRRKLHFTVTAPGEKALKEALATTDALKRGLRWTGQESFA